MNKLLSRLIIIFIILTLLGCTKTIVIYTVNRDNPDLPLGCVEFHLFGDIKIYQLEKDGYRLLDYAPSAALDVDYIVKIYVSPGVQKFKAYHPGNDPIYDCSAEFSVNVGEGTSTRIDLSAFNPEENIGPGRSGYRQIKRYKCRIWTKFYDPVKSNDLRL